jgi:hypothetical protein
VTLELPPDTTWYRLAHTALSSPNDLLTEDQAVRLTCPTYRLPAHSALLLVSRTK